MRREPIALQQLRPGVVLVPVGNIYQAVESDQLGAHHENRILPHVHLRPRQEPEPRIHAVDPVLQHILEIVRHRERQLRRVHGLPGVGYPQGPEGGPAGYGDGGPPHVVPDVALPFGLHVLASIIGEHGGCPLLQLYQRLGALGPQADDVDLRLHDPLVCVEGQHPDEAGAVLELRGAHDVAVGVAVEGGLVILEEAPHAVASHIIGQDQHLADPGPGLRHHGPVADHVAVTGQRRPVAHHQVPIHLEPGVIPPGVSLVVEGELLRDYPADDDFSVYGQRYPLWDGHPRHAVTVPGPLPVLPVLRRVRAESLPVRVHVAHSVGVRQQQGDPLRDLRIPVQDGAVHDYHEIAWHRCREGVADVLVQDIPDAGLAAAIGIRCICHDYGR